VIHHASLVLCGYAQNINQERRCDKQRPLAQPIYGRLLRLHFCHVHESAQVFVARQIGRVKTLDNGFG